MKLKSKITIFTGLILFAAVSITSSVSIYSIKRKANSDINQYRLEEINNSKERLKDIVEVAYGMIEVNYLSLKKDTIPGEDMHITLEKLSKIRFDTGEGYFWVTNNETPFPTMVMHAAKPQNNGKVMKDAKYNVVKGKDKNLYQERAELCNQFGEAFVEYVMVKPDQDIVNNKLSYSKLFKPLGWVISSGIYTDSIDEAMAGKQAKLRNEINNIILSVILASILILSAGIVLSYLFSNKLATIILRVQDKFAALSRGESVEKMHLARKDELGEMTKSLDSFVDGLASYTSFAREIGDNNLEAAFKPLSEEDALGNELIKMRDNLKKNLENDKVRNWTNTGFAKFDNSFRNIGVDLNEICQSTISDLVKYMGANQGCLFVAKGEGEELFLDLMGAYAFERQKYLKRQIKPGQDLVGQCYLEKKSIYLKEIPDQYINITSGLGDAPPKNILIVPLKTSNEVLGIIEIASFEIFKPYEIEFVEKLCENIAAVFSTINVTDKTMKLLDESKKMSEELKSQEEELRQNQEEMAATQEEMTRRLQELEKENLALKKEIKKS